VSISITNPKTGSTIPSGFTAFGTYTTADADPAKSAKCTLRPASGSPIEVPITLCQEGNWRANFFALPTDVTYSMEAFYTKADNHPVNATPETDLYADANAASVPILLPMCTPRGGGGGVGPGALAVVAKPALQLSRSAQVAADSLIWCGPPPVLEYHATYAKSLRFHKAVALLIRERARQPAAVLPVQTKFGTWSVLVPVPPDFPTVAYTLQIVWLDRDGLRVTHISFGLYIPAICPCP
jgi:hypothetical protein